jgi:hypothetical protein
MININKKVVVGLSLSILMLISPLFARLSFAPPYPKLFVDPAALTVEVGTTFTVDIKVADIIDLYSFEFWLGYDTNRMDAVDVILGPFLNPPTYISVKSINDTAGFVHFGAGSTAPTPSSGSGTLATVMFTCTGSGNSPLHLYSTMLLDFLGNPLLHQVVDGQVTQTPPWFVKPPYPDYAPNGMPDFDQKQDNWISPLAGWTRCGPVAVANSLWWFDSKYESLLNPSPVPPPTYSDKFPLLQPYGAWDDHDPRNVEPFVNNLAFLMDSDGIRTNLPHSGTFFADMEVGISQYLIQQGVNPKGDCNGDGVVDFADWLIWQKANGTVPGDPNWSMAADLIPDGRINDFDLFVITANFGKIGMFYEHTVEFPTFPWITEEVYACEDVVLNLEFWQDMGGGNWNRYMYDPGGQGGHYVTLAGINSTTSQVLLSDPWWDAFEANKTLGESPGPHVYPHNATVHNDAQFVSHDAYPVIPWMIPQPSPYPAPVWELLGYLQALGWDPTWHAFIRAAVATSPITVAVRNPTNSKEPCDPMPTVGQGLNVSINAQIVNFGLAPQTIMVTAYANMTAVGSTMVNLPPNTSISIRVTDWNTTGWAYGDYYVTVGTNASIQSFTSSNLLRVTVQGDINGDWVVDIYDAILLAGSYNAVPGSPRWDPNADLIADNVIDIYDAIILANHYNQHFT